ncbi:MAG TPA: amidohydrolase family protein [Pirellulales bacterium]|nr:amidohydrolase family protein [Pirellulales bacterium]
MNTDVVDVYVWLSRWPFRRLPADDTRQLVAKLKAGGVKTAWAGSFDGLFHRDLATVNERLTADCRELGDGLLRPFGSVNPKLPEWEDDLRRCHEVHAMPGVRLAPAYHGYSLEDPAVARLLAGAAERRLLVEILVSLEDQRTQTTLGRVPQLELAPLADLVKQTPGLRLVLLGAFHGGAKRDAIERLAASGEVYFEIATLEGMGGISRLIEWVTVERILFGSSSPFFYFDSARLKLQESELAGRPLEQIGSLNANRLLES